MRVEVETPKVEDAFEEMTKSFQRQVALPGFRPGKAPREMVVKKYAHDIKNEVKKKLIPDFYRQALTEQKLEVIGYPDIEEIQFEQGQPLQFAATIETAPEFELPEYKGVAAKRENGAVTEQDIEKAIQVLREQQTNFETVERELHPGDVAVVNYTGQCDNKPITETAPTAKGLTEQKNFWINMDPSSFIPGFADQLLGAKAGEKRTVTVDFPADFVTPQLANKKGIYEVELVEVKQKILPELNDTFAKSYEADTMEKLREAVRQDLQKELDEKRNRNIRAAVTQTILDKIQCELPESPVLQETRNIVYSIVEENQKRGISKELIDAQKDQIFASANLTAKERVKAAFLFQKIAQKEGIKVDQKEMTQRVEQLAAQYQTTPEKLVKEIQSKNGFHQIYEQLMNEKVIDWLVQNAKIEDVPSKPA